MENFITLLEIMTWAIFIMAFFATLSWRRKLKSLQKEKANKWVVVALCLCAIFSYLFSVVSQFNSFTLAHILSEKFEDMSQNIFFNPYVVIFTLIYVICFSVVILWEHFSKLKK